MDSKLPNCGPVPYLTRSYRNKYPARASSMSTLFAQPDLTIKLPTRPSTCPSCPPLILTFPASSSPLPLPSSSSEKPASALPSLPTPNSSRTSVSLISPSSTLPPTLVISQSLPPPPSTQFSLPKPPQRSTSSAPGFQLPPRPHPNQGATKVTSSIGSFTTAIFNPSISATTDPVIGTPLASIPKLVTSHLTVLSSYKVSPFLVSQPDYLLDLSLHDSRVWCQFQSKRMRNRQVLPLNLP